jgi:hypothetical protein
MTRCFVVSSRHTWRSNANHSSLRNGLEQVTVPPEQSPAIIGVCLAQIGQFGQQGIVRLGRPRVIAFPGLFLTGGEAAVEGPLDLAARAAEARAASTSARLISPSVINWPIEKPAVLRRWLRVPSGAPRTASASPCNAAAALRSSDAGLMAGIR